MRRCEASAKVWGKNGDEDKNWKIRQYIIGYEPMLLTDRHVGVQDVLRILNGTQKKGIS